MPGKLTTIAAALLTLEILMSTPLSAEVQTQTIKYKHGDVELEGFLAWNDGVEGKRPGVLIVHEWWGHNDYVRARAKKLAALGYVAFALDMYGVGKQTEHPQEAGQWATMIRQNVDQWRARGLAGLKVLQEQPQVDPSKVAVMGYCFGGSTAIQLAYGGADIRGAASFHGGLMPLPDADKEHLKASLLICHGADDAMIPDDVVQSFRKSLDAVDADYQVVYYSNTRHGFTNPAADSHGIENLKYNKKSDERSWRLLVDFLEEVFATP